jgi:hypothetical protein
MNILKQKHLYRILNFKQIQFFLSSLKMLKIQFFIYCIVTFHIVYLLTVGTDAAHRCSGSYWGS